MGSEKSLEEIKDVLCAFIKETFEIEDDPDFNDDVNLFEDGYVDSIDAIRIITFIEKHWDIEITQKDLILFPMNTINEIAEVVASKV